jgi:hypothetical protein
MALLLGSMWCMAILNSVLSGTAPTRVQLVVWPLDLVVAFPALFWGGVWLWRKQPLGYVAGGIVLLKAAAEGLTLMVQTWAVVLMGGERDPLLPAYAIVGLGGLAMLILYLRSVLPTQPAAPEIRNLEDSRDDEPKYHSAPQDGRAGTRDGRSGAVLQGRDLDGPDTGRWHGARLAGDDRQGARHVPPDPGRPLVRL